MTLVCNNVLFGKNRGVGLAYHLPSFSCCWLLLKGLNVHPSVNQPTNGNGNWLWAHQPWDLIVNPSNHWDFVSNPDSHKYRLFSMNLLAGFQLLLILLLLLFLWLMNNFMNNYRINFTIQLEVSLNTWLKLVDWNHPRRSSDWATPKERRSKLRPGKELSRRLRGEQRFFLGYLDVVCVFFVFVLLCIDIHIYIYVCVLQ